MAFSFLLWNGCLGRRTGPVLEASTSFRVGPPEAPGRRESPEDVVTQSKAFRLAPRGVIIIGRLLPDEHRPPLGSQHQP